MKIKIKLSKITPVELDDLKKHRKKINGKQTTITPPYRAHQAKEHND